MVYGNDCVTEKITLNRTYLVLYIGNTYRLKVKVCTKDGTTKVARWSSSDPAVLSVDAHTGIVRAKKAGMAYVFIDSLEGGDRTYCEIVVKETVACCDEGKINSCTDVQELVDVNFTNNTIVSLHNGCEVFVCKNLSPYLRCVDEDICCEKIVCCTCNKENIHSERLNDSLQSIKGRSDTEFASEMLKTVASDLLKFENILKANTIVTRTILVGNGTTINLLVRVGSGRGNVDVGTVVSKQLSLIAEFPFNMRDYGSVSVTSDGSVNIEYCADVDDHTTIAALFSKSIDLSIAAEYAITTIDEYNNSVATIIGLNHKFQNSNITNICSIE